VNRRVRNALPDRGERVRFKKSTVNVYYFWGDRGPIGWEDGSRPTNKTGFTGERFLVIGVRFLKSVRLWGRGKQSVVRTP